DGTRRWVLRREALEEGGGRRGSHQQHRTAAETAPGHARAEDAALLPDCACDLDDGVELGRAHLEIAAERFVAQVHEPPRLAPAVRRNGCGGLLRPLDLGDHVAYAPEAQRIELLRGTCKVARGERAQRWQLQLLRGRLALSAPKRVLAVGERMPDIRTGDEHRDLGIGE